MPKNIIAIGGGKVMVPSVTQVETLKIDKAIVRASGKASPRLLFIPTASSDNLEYCQAIEHLYSSLGCQVDFLLLYHDRPGKRKIKKLIEQADIIYVGGGNTLRMMKYWRRLNIDSLLESAYQRGVVMCGLSAGAICWFAFGNSDSRKFADQKNKQLIKVKGLGLVDLLLCPHYDTEQHRQNSLKKMMQQHPTIAVALENNTAIHICNDKYRILSSQKNKHAWKVFWQHKQYYREDISNHTGYRSMNRLLQLHEP